jgi:hypothetical protein
LPDDREVSCLVKEPSYTDGLSDELLEQPDLALDAAQGSIQAELLALLLHVGAILGVRQWAAYRSD